MFYFNVKNGLKKMIFIRVISIYNLVLFTTSLQLFNIMYILNYHFLIQQTNKKKHKHIGFCFLLSVVRIQLNTIFFPSTMILSQMSVISWNNQKDHLMLVLMYLILRDSFLPHLLEYQSCHFISFLFIYPDHSFDIRYSRGHKKQETLNS